MNVNIACPINSLSYGLASLNILKNLAVLGHNLSVFPIGNVHLENPEDKPLVQEWVNNQTKPDASAPSLKIYHQFDLLQRLGRGKHFGFPFFELDRFNERELINLRSCDGIICSSEWALRVLEANGIEDTYVVPLGVDRSIFYEGQSQWNEPFRFICVGKIEVRKGHDVLPHIINGALPKGGDWHLRMVWGNPFIKQEEKQQWESYYRSLLGDNVSFCDRVGTQADIANEMRAADCGISISRAEGWDLPLLELMSCGKPVIATNYSAHTEFCTSANSHLIDVTELEEANDGRWFFGQGRWAKLGNQQLDQIVYAVRMAYAAGKNVRNEAGIETAERFSWKATAKKLASVLE